MAVTIIFLTSGSTWTVPVDWDNAANTIEVIGGGGGMSMGQPNVQVDGAGGGGAYSKITNATLTPSAVLNINVGTGGTGATTINTNGITGGDTWLANNNTATLITSPGVIVGAKGGAFGVRNNQTPAQGGQAASGIVTGVSTIKYSGGTAGQSGGAGGGGAAGRFGPGGTGGGPAGGSAGAGGGGASGGAAGTNASGTTGGNGGASGAGGATVTGSLANSNGTNGTNGSGGGGAGNSASPGSTHGGNGGPGIDWDASHGAGGGGGGSGGGNGAGTNNTAAAANGGLYGGGGGCGWAGDLAGGGNGAQGIIVITYGQATPTPIISARIQRNYVAYTDEYVDDDITARTIVARRLPQVTTWAFSSLAVSKFVQYIITSIPNNAVMSGKVIQYIVLETLMPLRRLITQQQQSSWEDFDQEPIHAKNILFRSKNLTIPELMQPLRHKINRQQQEIWEDIEQEAFFVRKTLLRGLSAALPGVTVPVVGVQGSGLTDDVIPNPSGVPVGVSATGLASSPDHIEIDIGLPGVFGTGQTGAAIPVAVISGVAASGAAQDLIANVLAVPFGTVGTGVAQSLNVEIDVSIVGVEGDGLSGDTLPAVPIFGVEGDGTANNLIPNVIATPLGASGTGVAQPLSNNNIEIDITFSGVQGLGLAGLGLPAAPTSGVTGIGVANDIAFIEIDAFLNGVEGDGFTGSFGFASDTGISGTEGEGLVNDAIANVEPVVNGVEGDGFAGSVNIETTFNMAGGVGIGEAETLEVEIDVGINGVFGTGFTDDVVAGQAIDGISANGFAGILDHLLETSILIGVEGEGRVGTAIEVAVAQGVFGTGLTDDITHILNPKFIGVTATGFAHSLFSHLFSASTVRESLSHDRGGVALSQFVRESFMTEHVGNAALRHSVMAREIFTKNVDSVMNVGMIHREIVLYTLDTLNPIHMASFDREIILKEFQTMRVAALYRETLMTDGGPQFTPTVLVVT